MEKQRVILIAGPTASGKSALAAALAERLGGTVINSDSMQVYRELSVLTARPTAAEEARVPHKLYGFVPGRVAYSAARFTSDAAQAIEEVRAAGRVPIIAGGTGLYFKALLEGFSPVPPVPEEIRAHWRGEAERLGAGRLHAVLSERDPLTAGRLKPTDPQRIVRALEVFEATGQALAKWQETPGEPVLREDETARFVVAAERGALHKRCDARFEQMMGAGAVEEVEGLAALGLDSGLPVMRALGVRPLLDLVRGLISREEAAARGKAETRQYVKRQVTWLSRNMIAWNSIAMKQTESTVDEIIGFINSKP